MSQETIEISGGAMFSMFQRNFPWLEVGEDLFITSPAYVAYPLSSYLRIFTALRVGNELPSCPFPATTAALAELHKRFGTIVAAGYGMIAREGFPPWLIIFAAIDCGRVTLYSYDIAEGRLLDPIPKVSLILF
ncbi:MAG: hypothetical protein U9Q96_00535 [Patescibacteria group bacterium]|nr:hypothetical protein [Patescibacteria group bacterium]